MCSTFLKQNFVIFDEMLVEVEVFKMAICHAVSDETFNKMIFPFQCSSRYQWVMTFFLQARDEWWGKFEKMQVILREASTKQLDEKTAHKYYWAGNEQGPCDMDT